MIKDVCYVTFRVSYFIGISKFAIRCKDEDQARDVAMDVFLIQVRKVYEDKQETSLGESDQTHSRRIS